MTELRYKSWSSMSYEEKWSSESLGMVQNVWKLSSKDLANLLKLKAVLKDIQSPLNQPFEVARCYRDAHGNVQKAADKFRNTVAWRQKKRIDSLLVDFRPPPLMQKYNPSCCLHDYDREGDPIWYIPMGASDPWAVFSKYGHDAFLTYTWWALESCLRGEFAQDYEHRNHGRPPARCTVILDMDGLCWRHLQPGLIPIVEETISLTQEHCMGYMKRIVVARAPVIFRIVWSVVQHFCSDELKQKIVFGDHRTTLKILDQYIDRAVLPPCLCSPDGKGKPGVGFPPSLEGGIMSQKELLESDDIVVEVLPKADSKRQQSYETLACDSYSTAEQDDSALSAACHDGSGDETQINNLHQALGPVSVRTSLILRGIYTDDVVRCAY